MKTSTDCGKYADVPVRVKSWGYIIFVLAAMLLHPLSMSVIATLLSLYALWEYFTMTSVVNKALRYTAYSMSIPVFISLYTCNYRLFVLVVAIYIIVLLLINVSLAKAGNRHIHIIAGVALCVFPIGHLAFIRELNNPQEQIDGVKLVLYLVLLTELNDVFQYLTGKAFGKRKITPRISPNKTVEGFIGGVVLTILLSYATGWFLFPQKSIAVYTVAGIMIAVLGFCGDLLMSLIKRKSKVKDTGTLIPGHGGLLDRMDSLLLVLPVSYWSILLLYFNL